MECDMLSQCFGIYSQAGQLDLPLHLTYGLRRLLCILLCYSIMSSNAIIVGSVYEMVWHALEDTTFCLVSKWFKMAPSVFQTKWALTILLHIDTLDPVKVDGVTRGRWLCKRPLCLMCEIAIHLLYCTCQSTSGFVGDGFKWLHLLFVCLLMRGAPDLHLVLLMSS